MMMSPDSILPASVVTVCSVVAPAGTINHAARGGLSARTNSFSEVVAVAPSLVGRVRELLIRLRREGSLNNPYYKVVIADQRSPRDGKFIELVGNYDPKKPGDNANIDLSRIDYWIQNGAQPSDTVRSIIKKARKKEVAAAK